jgi:hypothetical protein
VFEWRVTKYDPERRDDRGAFLDDDWTSISDIGNSYGGTALTLAEYLATEDRYVASALAFLRESGIPRLVVEDLEVAAPSAKAQELGLSPLSPPEEGARLDADGVADVVRMALREDIWCRLEAPGRFFIHFGYDYYMYVGSRADLPAAVAETRRLGLYVELFPSPHLPRAEYN